nr:zinc-binding dehydrogenase [Kineococcus siccus]
MVEPGGNAVRAVDAAAAGEGSRLLVVGPGTIGLLCALFARARGAETHVLGRDAPSLDLARRLGFAGTWTADDLPRVAWDAVVDATDDAAVPSSAVDLVEPGGRVVLIGVSRTPSSVDTRRLVRGDVTAVGVLGASAGLRSAVDAYAAGVVDPAPLVAETIPLELLPDELSGRRPRPAGSPPKVHVDPWATPG